MINLNDFHFFLIRTDNRDEQSELKLSIRNAEMRKANRRIPN